MITEEERLNEDVPLETIIKYLLKERDQRELKIRRLKQTIGEMKSYTQELNWKIRNISNGHRVFNKEVKREEMYNNLIDQIILKNERIKLLKNSRNALLQKVNELENKLKEK